MTPARPTAAGELGGAFGDLGTLLPILLGAVTVAGMSAGGVLVSFGAFLLATRLLYRLPLPVQPMKAVGALVIAGGSHQARSRLPTPVFALPHLVRRNPSACACHLAPAAGDPDLHLDLNRPACVTEVPPDFLAHGAAGLL
jgi:hypothetical protein